jgi:N-acyl homoserine lactone hydrolase
MSSVSLLLPGIPARSSRGFFGFCSISLIRSSRGLTVFDSGYQGDRQALQKALRDLEIDLSEIRTLVLSHLHYDHAANWRIFHSADIYVSAAEAAYAVSSARDSGVMDDADRLLESPRVKLLEFGRADELQLDEGLTVLLAPGHTPGSIALAVKDSAGATWCLCGDAVKSLSDISAAEAGGATDSRTQETMLSVQKLVATADFLVPGHDRVIDVRGGTAVPCGSAIMSLEIF